MPIPNLLAQPRKWKKKAVLIKEEEAYATDPTLSGLVDFIEARNVTLTSFEAETTDRNLIMPYMGNGGKLITSIWSKLSFEVALTGGGAAGTVPKWGFLLLAAGFAETTAAGVSATYNLVSEDISSLAAYINIDGTLHKLMGSRGTASCALSAKGIPLLKVELTSLYTTPVEEAAPTVDRTGWQIEQAVTSVNTGKLTLGATDLAWSSFEWSLGNNVKAIDLPGPQREVLVLDRAPTASATVLAPALSVFNPYALAEANSIITLSNTHGTAAGKKIKTDMKVKLIGVSEDQVDDALAYKLTFSPEPVAGNDEITLTIQ